MRKYIFEVEYLGGINLIREVQATSLAAAWFQIALKHGEYARGIKLISSNEGWE
ncbi:hypothetical protein D3C74_303670 [compost metagenome]